MHSLIKLTAILLTAVPALAPAQERESVEQFVTGRYYHGLPRNQAALYGSEETPTLVGMLAQERHRSSWAQIVVLLGLIGDDAATPALIDLVETRFDGVVDLETYRALMAAPVAIGEIAHRGGERARQWLGRTATPAAWADRAIGWTAPTLDAASRPILLTKLQIQGIARIGDAESLARLRNIRARLGDAPARKQLEPSIEDAIALNRRRMERRDEAPDQAQ